MKLISFYCDVDGGNFYKNSSKNLIQDCIDFGIDYHIDEYNFGTSWIDNVRAKPTFILEMMEKFNQDLLWLDIDCRINKNIDFPTDSDWLVDFKKNGSPHDYVHIIKNTEENKQFLLEWIKEINDTKSGSHTAFIKIYNKINVNKIPFGYFTLGLSDIDSKKTYINGK